MNSPVPLTFDAPVIGALALLVLVGAIAVAALRRPAMPTSALVLAGIGGAVLALAAGGAAWQARDAAAVVVMVDLSPSTRGANYRDPAELRRRIEELLGKTPHEIRWFADGLGSIDSAAAAAGLVPDLPATRTVLPAAEAAAVVLFSDGRSAGPGAGALPPTYCVVDPALEDVEDAAVTALEVRGNAVAVGIRNGGAERPLALQGAAGGPSTVPVGPGTFVLNRKLTPVATSVSATFSPGDLWPENDSLRAIPPPAAERQRWWVGQTDPGDGWTHIMPGELPVAPARFLAASVVVLDDVAADTLDEPRRAALRRYVEDLGGGLVIVGGERAFAAGRYAGTTLDALSPLASTPPEPTTHWLLLADASGSMNQPAQGAAGEVRTRWQHAADALTSVARQLPPADLLSIGSFAQDLRWWSQRQPVEQARSLELPPADVRPRGPTNLDAVLRQVAAAEGEGMPQQLLLATDGNAEIGGPGELAAQLKSKQVRLHVLLIGEADASGLPALREIAAATGGAVRVERLPENWATGLRELMRAAQPTAVMREPVDVAFTGEVQEVGSVAATLWNRTWPRAGIEPLASATFQGEPVPMAARWNVGAGRVLAVAMPMPAARARPLADLVARPPRDPRFNLSWESGTRLRVTVDATDGPRFLNGEALTLETRGAGGPSNGAPDVKPIPQTAPGRYELSLDAPRQPVIAAVRLGPRILDTIAVAERYAPEFDAIGNDRSALSELARRTGGAVVEPGVARRLDLPRPRRPVPLVSSLATGGAALIAAGLVRWRIGS